MKKIRSVLLLIAMLLPLLAVGALAEAHPDQSGYQGEVPAPYVHPDQYGYQGGFDQGPGAQGGGIQLPVADTEPTTPKDSQAQANSGNQNNSSTGSGSQTLDWYGVGYDLINKYPNITVYDINSGTTWNAKYINGKNHADIIPASKGDADKLTAGKITGSYVRRPVLVTINGTQYAGSMYAVGHGETSYCDYFQGVMCIHFTGSQTHGSKKVDADHQNAIQDALTYGN